MKKTRKTREEEKEMEYVGVKAPLLTYTHRGRSWGQAPGRCRGGTCKCPWWSSGRRSYHTWQSHSSRSRPPGGCGRDNTDFERTTGPLSKISNSWHFHGTYKYEHRGIWEVEVVEMRIYRKIDKQKNENTIEYGPMVNLGRREEEIRKTEIDERTKILVTFCII